MTDRMQSYDYRANREWIELLNELGERCPTKAAKWVSHILNAQHIWLCRMADLETEVGPWDASEPGNWMGVLDRNHKSLTAILEEGDLQREYIYSNTKGESFKSTVGDTLLHLLLHGQYHRGQIASLVKSETGKSIPTDYIFYHR